jgi:predicted short-subunit dehydrogenase-like oxidoreductase (DUF2520 family)
MISIVILGSGNVAQHLIKTFGKLSKQSNQIVVKQVYTRNPEALRGILNRDKITNHTGNIPEADVYLIAVSDNAIKEVSSSIPFSNKLVIHTSGSMGLEEIDTKNRSGVLYPLQTFSKSKAIDFSTIPIGIEATNEKDILTVKQIANVLSKKVFVIDSAQRKALHVAAVFVCNFVNHMYHIGQNICEEHQIPFEIMQPLIEETADKIKILNPKEAQTGPAIRNDQKTIDKHLGFLSNDIEKNIYNLITQSIQSHGKKL